jgi:hypothetical protein
MIYRAQRKDETTVLILTILDVVNHKKLASEYNAKIAQQMAANLGSRPSGSSYTAL